MVSLGGICMGVLLNPHVVVYPAHCGTQHESVRTRHGSRATTRCEAIPEWNTSGRDIAYCLLGVGDAETVQALSALPPCAHELAVGDRLHLLAQSDDFAEAASVSVESADVDLVAADPRVGVCPGASGGPAFYQTELPDGSPPKLAGLISAGEFGCELGQDIYLTPIQPYLGWLEQRTGLDLTPCMNDQGAWELSGRCLDAVAPGARLGTCGEPVFRNRPIALEIEEAEVVLAGSLDSPSARFLISASPEQEISEVWVTLSSEGEPPRVQRRRWELLAEIEFRGLTARSYSFDIVLVGVSGSQLARRRSLNLSPSASGCQFGSRVDGLGIGPWSSFVLAFAALGARCGGSALSKQRRKQREE